MKPTTIRQARVNVVVMPWVYEKYYKNSKLHKFHKLCGYKIHVAKELYTKHKDDEYIYIKNSKTVLDFNKTIG